ncbi:MAG: hypothetical protein K6A80_09250, partial [Saccharofermentans sp.]|nr:hypothetical protein [Saccharofermentans sp.]
LINAPGTALEDGCKFEYAFGTDDKAVPTDGWGETVPAQKEVGTYYVWYRIIGNDNYNDSDPAVITVSIEHKHDPLHHERIDATEDAEGSIEYWECKVCRKLFSDAACTQEIAAENIVINKLGHDLEHHSRVEPTETTAGNIEYWVCKGCNKFFSDAEGKNEITEAQTVLAKLPDARTVAETPAPVAQTATINDKSVELKTQVSHLKAVTWTGGKITKEQLSALSEDGVIAKIEASGLKEALTKYNDSKVKPSDLFTTSCKITGKDITDSNTKAYFIVKIKLNSKKLKKAGISKDDKKALQAIVDELNKKLEKDPFYFEIRPVKLDEEGVSVSVKAAFSKKKFVQKNEDRCNGETVDRSLKDTQKMLPRDFSCGSVLCR